MTDKQLFSPTGYRLDKSRIDGKPYYTIWFDYLNKNVECQTYVHQSCRNYQHWEAVTSKLNNKDLFISFEPLVWKDEKRGLIDADSVPFVELETAKGEMQAEIRNWRQEQEPQPRKRKKVKPQGQFGNLFEIED